MCPPTGSRVRRHPSQQASCVPRPPRSAVGAALGPQRLRLRAQLLPVPGAGPETRGTLVSCTSGRCRPRASACRLSRLTRVTPPVTGEGVRAGFPGGRVCVCVHMHVCMCSHVCACIFVRVVHVCVLVCLCVRVCMYVCMHTRASGGFHMALVNYWGSRVGVPYSPPLLKRLRSRSPGASVPAVGAPGPGEPRDEWQSPPIHTPCQVCGSTGPRPCPGLAWTWFRTFLGGRAGQLLIFAGEVDSDSREDVGFPLRPRSLPLAGGEPGCS